MEINKSLFLASLMKDWEVMGDHVVIDGVVEVLNPYESLSQFAEIFLNFPEVVERFNSVGSMYTGYPPSQQGFLDEIISMHYK